MVTTSDIDILENICVAVAICWICYFWIEPREKIFCGARMYSTRGEEFSLTSYVTRASNRYIRQANPTTRD